MLRQVPGFRSGRRWKQFIALLIYGAGLLATIGRLWSLGVIVLLAAVLIANPAGWRSRLPLLGAASPLTRGAGYAGVGLLGLVLFLANAVAITPPAPNPASTAPAAAPPTAPTLTAAPVVAEAVPPTATVAPPTPLPPTSTATSVPPTATPVPPTPTPPPPTPTPEPIVLEGRGQTATQSLKPPSQLSVVTLTHRGTRNFIVKTFRGSTAELLVNRIGRYDGQRPLSGDALVIFDIDADGPWTLRIDPLDKAGVPAFSGKGDAVSNLFFPPAPGPWLFSHAGTANFIVKAHCASGSTLVQNKIGSVEASGIVQFRGSPCFWEVEADGAWDLKPRT